MKHVLVTRFNVRLQWHAHGDERWTDDRLDLFERTLLASVLGQTSRDFTWLVFFDESTTSLQRERIAGMSRDGSVFTAVYISEVFGPEHVRAELRTLCPSADLVLSTRVDNDDALARDFMATVRAHAEQVVDQAPVFLNPTYGVQFDGRLLYRRPWPWNAFVSLLEPGSEPMSIFVDQHYSLGRHGPCKEIGSGEPLWLQHIHGGNLANRVNGLPMRRIGPVLRRFAVEISPSPARTGDVAAAIGRIAFRAARHPSKLRAPVRVVASRLRRVAGRS